MDGSVCLWFQHNTRHGGIGTGVVVPHQDAGMGNGGDKLTGGCHTIKDTWLDSELTTIRFLALLSAVGFVD